MRGKMGQTYRYRLPDEEATRRFGSLLAGLLRPDDVLGLIGDLGAGKTTLTQGLASALELPKGAVVNSPTFTICNEYPTRPRLLHYDFYRLSNDDELFETGFEDAMRSGAICVVEWFDCLPSLLSIRHLRIDLSIGSEDRIISLSPSDAFWEARLASRADLFSEFERI